MALTWDTTGIKNRDEVCTHWTKPDPFEHGVFATVDDALEVGWREDSVRLNDRGEVEIRILNPVTNVLIFATMSTEIGDLNERNLPEFYARFSILQAVDGPYVRKNGEPYTITVEEVVAHLGLKTNASYKPSTRSAWTTRVITKGKLEEMHALAKSKLAGATETDGGQQ